MASNLARLESLLEIEEEVFGAMVEAHRQDDEKIAERLFAIWRKLPNFRPWPIGCWPQITHR